MVCVPCVAITVFLIVWRFLIQPLILKWWQLKSKDKDGTKDEKPAEPVKECKNGVCTLSWKKKQQENSKTD